MTKYQIKYKEIGKDLTETVDSAMYASGCAFFFLAGQYINTKFFDGQLDYIEGSTSLFSKEFAFFATEFVFMTGAAVETIKTGYNIAKMPLKTISGKYLKRKRISKSNKGGLEFSVEDAPILEAKDSLNYNS
jgi:hypothetical protein